MMLMISVHCCDWRELLSHCDEWWMLMISVQKCFLSARGHPRLLSSSVWPRKDLGQVMNREMSTSLLASSLQLAGDCW